MKVCEFSACGRTARSGRAEWCDAHYSQVRRGRPLTPIQVLPPVEPFCTIEGCDRAAVGRRRHCRMHRARIERHGDPHKVIQPSDRNILRGPDSPKWLANPTYNAVHIRLRKLFGEASGRQCACGAAAQQWAYTGPRNPGDVMPFGPLDQYEAMCVPCHKAYDLAAFKAAS